MAIKPLSIREIFSHHNLPHNPVHFVEGVSLRALGFSRNTKVSFKNSA